MPASLPSTAARCGPTPVRYLMSRVLKSIMTHLPTLLATFKSKGSGYLDVFTVALRQAHGHALMASTTEGIIGKSRAIFPGVGFFQQRGVKHLGSLHQLISIPDHRPARAALPPGGGFSTTSVTGTTARFSAANRKQRAIDLLATQTGAPPSVYPPPVRAASTRRSPCCTEWKRVAPPSATSWGYGRNGIPGTAPPNTPVGRAATPR